MTHKRLWEQRVVLSQQHAKGLQGFYHPLDCPLLYLKGSTTQDVPEKISILKKKSIIIFKILFCSLSTSKLGRKILISLQYKEISLDQLQETASVSRGSAAAFKGPCVWQKVVFDFSFLKGFTWGRQQLFLPWVVGYFLGLEAEVGWCGLECQAALLSTHASEVCNLSP